MLLIAALVFVLLASGAFFVQSFKENWASLVPPGLAVQALGLACWIADALHAQGKI